MINQKSAFLLPDGLTYVDGNSLGPSTHAAQERISEVVIEQWQPDLIQSWNKHSWFDLPERVGNQIAPLIGAAPDTVTVCDSTSVNLFKVLSAALPLRPERKIIISDTVNFPTDYYVAQGLIAALGQAHELRRVDRAQLPEAIADAGENLAAIMLTQVDYTSGACLDIAVLTELAHQQGALTIWDLAHSAGAAPLQMAHWKVDFAIGCGYKFLNGGPGAPSFIYVSPSHAQAVPALQGWMGHAKPFAFTPDHTPDTTIRRFRTGTPSIIALSALSGALTVFDDVDMLALNAEANRLIDIAIQRLDNECTSLEILTPRTAAQRGSQIALQPKDNTVSAYAIVQALIARDIVGDFRQPNIARFGIAPLYNDETDIHRLVDNLIEIVATDSWNQPEFLQQSTVT